MSCSFSCLHGAKLSHRLIHYSKPNPNPNPPGFDSQRPPFLKKRHPTSTLTIPIPLTLTLPFLKQSRSDPNPNPNPNPHPTFDRNYPSTLTVSLTRGPIATNYALAYLHRQPVSSHCPIPSSFGAISIGFSQGIEELTSWSLSSNSDQFKPFLLTLPPLP